MDSKEYILTQDIGIYSCKAALFSFEGETICTNRVDYTPNIVPGSCSTQPPATWWNAFCLNCRKLLRNVPANSVKAVCVSGQMMGCLSLGRDGQPLYDHITWDDRRDADQINKIQSLLSADTIHSITGICLSYMFSLPKIMWLREHFPDIYQNTWKFIQCKDYINYRLTGVLATDESDAGFTLMYDLLKKRWSDTILSACEIDAAKLPEVIPFGTVLGKVTPDASADCGLAQDTLVVEGLGDGRTPTVGSGLSQKGQGLVYVSSTAWFSQVTDSAQIDQKRILTKCSYTNPELLLNGGTVLSAGHSIDWFVNAFYPASKSTHLHRRQELFARMNHVPIGSNGLLFIPHLRGERTPWWNNFAKGSFVGLASYHTQDDLFRSVIEGVSFQLALVCNSIQELEPFSSLYFSGSQATPQWQQLLSDIFDMEIVTSDIKSIIGCVGAAVTAGIGLGIYSGPSAAHQFHHNYFYTSPIKENVELYRELIPVFEDCYNALRDINQYLSHMCRNQN